MKKTLLKTSAIALLLFGTGVVNAQETEQSADSLTLNLEECIKIALDRNPSVKVAELEIKRVNYSKNEIIGKLLPSISFGGTYSRTIEKQTMYFDMKAMGGGSGAGAGDEKTQPKKSESKDAGIKVGLDNAYQLGFNATLPIIAPQLWKSISLSKTQVLQNVEKARASKLNLINQIQKTYYTILLARDSYKVVKQNYENAKYNAEIIEGKFKVGAASEFDVLRTSVHVTNIEPQLIQSDIAIKQAYLQLKVLMGIDVATKIGISSELKDYEKEMYEETLKIDRNIGNNTELRSLDLQTKYLKDALKVQQMSWCPTLAIAANYNWTSMSNGPVFDNFRWSPYSTVGLSLSIPIFQGGQRYNKIKQADVAVREMGFHRENLERGLNMQVDLQLDNIYQNVKQISSNAASVKQAQKAFDIIQKSFNIGAAAYVDLRDAELALTSSKLAYYQAIYNYLVAHSDLDLLLGTEDPEKYLTPKN